MGLILLHLCVRVFACFYLTFDVRPFVSIHSKIFASAPDAWFVACALSVALAIAIMEITGTSHPPGLSPFVFCPPGVAPARTLGKASLLLPVGQRTQPPSFPHGRL